MPELKADNYRTAWSQQLSPLATELCVLAALASLMPSEPTARSPSRAVHPPQENVPPEPCKGPRQLVH